MSRASQKKEKYILWTLALGCVRVLQEKMVKFPNTKWQRQNMNRKWIVEVALGSDKVPSISFFESLLISTPESTEPAVQVEKKVLAGAEDMESK